MRNWGSSSRRSWIRLASALEDVEEKLSSLAPASDALVGVEWLF